MTTKAVETSRIKVGSQSDPNEVGGCIAATVRKEGEAKTQTIGTSALNQAMKAIAIARGYLASDGIDLVCYPACVKVEVDGVARTVTRLFVEPRVPMPAV